MIYIKLDCTWRTTSSTIRSIPEIHFAKMEAGVRNMTEGANDRQAAGNRQTTQGGQTPSRFHGRSDVDSGKTSELRARS